MRAGSPAATREMGVTSRNIAPPLREVSCWITALNASISPAIFPDLSVSFYSNSLIPGTTYTFSVRAVVDLSTIGPAGVSAPLAAPAPPGAPAGVTAQLGPHQKIADEFGIARRHACREQVSAECSELVMLDCRHGGSC